VRKNEGRQRQEHVDELAKKTELAGFVTLQGSEHCESTSPRHEKGLIVKPAGQLISLQGVHV